jgi:hypothetical protein
MGFGGGVLLAAVGAVLAFAVDVNTSGFNINTIGIILMIAGGVLILLSLAFWSSWGGFHREVVNEGPTRTRVIDEY